MIDSGIYKIECVVNKKTYIGSSISFAKRWRAHRCGLNKNRHYNTKLQRSWNKHGKECFVFSILETVENEKDLIAREQFWINEIAPELNICLIAGRTTGIKQSLAQKQSTSKRLLGNKHRSGTKVTHSQETKDKIAKTLKGTRHSPESYRQAGLKLKGRVTRFNWKPTAETLKKLSESHMGQVAWNKGTTGVMPRGINHGNAKFSENDILLIRKSFSEGKNSMEISREYGVSFSTINRIVNRLSWKHI